MRRQIVATAGALALLASGAPAVSENPGPTPVAGVPAENVGVHGPLTHHLDGLELVAHAPIRPAGESSEGLGNNGAVSLIGDCAYVGRWHDYSPRGRAVQIVDVDAGSPTYTEVVGEVPETLPVGFTPRELRAIDLPGAEMLLVLTFAASITDNARQQFNTLRLYTFPEGDCRKPVLAGMYDLLGFRPHEFFLWIDPDPARAVAGRPRALAYIATPIGPPNLFVVEVTDPAAPRLLTVWDAAIPVVSTTEEAGTFLGNYLHSISISPDGRRGFLSYWDAGFLTVDTSDLADARPLAAIRPLGLASVPYDYSPPDVGNTHSAALIPGTNAVVVGDEVYQSTDGCPYGWMRIVDAGSLAEPPHEIGEFRLEENHPEACDPQTGMTTRRNADGVPVDGTFTIHNQTVGPRYTFVSWYGGGMRVVDLADPRNPVEAGAFVPAPLETVRSPSVGVTPFPPQGGTLSTADDWHVETWSYPVLRDGLIYLTDIRNGLFILRPAAGAPFAGEVAGTPFREGNSNLGDVWPE